MVIATGFAVEQWTRIPKRFGVVAEGKLYRCGEISSRELAWVQESHGVHTVLSLLNPDVPETQSERIAAEELGLNWLNIGLKGDGSSTPEQRDQIRSIVCDPQNEPLLVHCAAGSNRTGLAIGIYRINVDGWSYEQVLNEMRAYGFDDLPKHENLRAALREEAARAQSARSAMSQP